MKKKSLPQITKSRRSTTKLEFTFTKRESEVVVLYAKGESRKEIGEKLGIVPMSVGSSLQRIRRKFRTKSKADIIAVAIKHGLLPIPE